MDVARKEKVEQKTDANPLQDVIQAEQGTQVQYNMTTNRDGAGQHPQPTTDPLDPLNWSSFRKHTILGIVMLKYEFTSCKIWHESLSNASDLDIFSSPTSRPQQSLHSQKYKPSMV